MNLANAIKVILLPFPLTIPLPTSLKLNLFLVMQQVSQNFNYVLEHILYIYISIL